MSTEFMEFIRAWYCHKEPAGEWKPSHIHKIRMAPEQVTGYKSIEGSNVVDFKLECGDIHTVWITLEEFETMMGF